MTHAKTRAALVALVALVTAAAAVGYHVVADDDGVTEVASSQGGGPRSGFVSDPVGDVGDIDPQAPDPDKSFRDRMDLTGTSLTSSGETVFVHVFHDEDDYAFADAPVRQVSMSLYFAPPGHYDRAAKDRPDLVRTYLEVEHLPGEEPQASLEVTADDPGSTSTGRQPAPCAEGEAPASVAEPMEMPGVTTYAIPVDCLAGDVTLDELPGQIATWWVTTTAVTSGDRARDYGWWDRVSGRRVRVKG